MKILNLYAGIGGNRKLWGDDHDITAVELDPKIAAIYKDFFPNDTVIVGDAHQYLLDHYKEFDFIWSSPPCPTHSRLRLLSVNRGLIDLKYPEMSLYQEVILLNTFFDGKYCVENVKPYYKPLIPAKESGRHLFWTNFNIGEIKTSHLSIKNKKSITLNDRMDEHGFMIGDWHGYKGDKHKILKNCVHPDQGKYIFECAQLSLNASNVNQIGLFAQDT